MAFKAKTWEMLPMAFQKKNVYQSYIFLSPY